MKANYKIVANKQKMLEKEIENFEPTSTMSVLLMRYSIIQVLLQVKLNEKDENGIPNISPVDMAYEMTTFFGDAVNAAAEYIAHAEDDGSKASEMFKGDSSEKHKSKGWNSASTKNKRS